LSGIYSDLSGAGSVLAARMAVEDFGGSFRSKAFVQACKELGIARRFTRAYRPQTKALTS
jgi:transposase InsO family protein